MISKIIELRRKKIIYGIILSNALYILIGGFILLLLLGSDDSDETDKTTCSADSLPVEIQEFEPTLTESMETYGIPLDYTDVLLAQLYQESGGIESILATDPWQSSESYCGSVGCITSPELSTNQAMKVHSDNIAKAKKLGLEPTKELILQSYNYGSGYMSWLSVNDKAYSQDTAYEYSVYMTDTYPSYGATCNIDPKGEACYGDYLYVSHVMSKMDDCDVNAGGDSNIEIDVNSLYVPYFDGEYTITCDYGCYTNHTGVDLVSTTDEKVYAVGEGDVVEVNNSCPQAGYIGSTCGYGFGNHVVVRHNLNGVNLYSIYGHMSNEVVSVGDHVDANTYLGTQGGSGNVTGPHLHLEFRYRTLSQENSVNIFSLLAKRER